MTADLQLAVSGLVSAVIQVGIGAVVLGVVFILVWATVRGALK